MRLLPELAFSFEHDGSDELELEMGGYSRVEHVERVENAEPRRICRGSVRETGAKCQDAAGETRSVSPSAFSTRIIVEIVGFPPWANAL